MEPSRIRDGERRHDLDALRAGAMLLGLVLHGAMAYTGAPWIVQDSHSNGLLGLSVSAIHGFRMPVFFMMSGFFTALLWQKRGLKSLVKNRFKRIFLPLLLGLVTVIPLMNWVSMIALSRGSAAGQKQGAERDLWTLAKEGDVPEIEKRLAAGADINQLDAKYRLSPLSWAAVAGQEEAVDLLLASGAKQELAGQSSSPLHTASLFGHASVVEMLIQNGGDVNSKNYEGKTPLESTQIDENTAQFVAKLFGVTLDLERYREGQKQTSKLLIDSGGRTAEGFTGLEDKAQTASPRWNWLLDGSLFGHLWFLWHLCWLVAGFVVVALAVERLGVKQPPAWLVVSPMRFLWLIPLTMIPQAMMGNWGEVPNFGPDTSLGLLPQPHVLLYYAIFFAFGATYFGSHDEQAKVGRHWRKMLALGLLVLFPLGIGLVFGGREGIRSHHPPMALRLRAGHLRLGNDLRPDGPVPPLLFGRKPDTAISFRLFLLALPMHMPLIIWRRWCFKTGHCPRYSSSPSFSLP